MAVAAFETPTPRHLFRRPVHPTGLWGWFTTIDHKRIGLLYSATAFVFFIIGGIEALVLRLQLGGPNGHVVDANTYNQIVTIVNMRAPGMSLMRMPIFVWMTLIAQFLLLFAIPVITVALFELMFDRLFGANFFNIQAGADPLLWQHLFWLFGHPEVYILVLPAMGIVSEV